MDRASLDAPSFYRGDLKKTHALIDKSRLMRVLWPVISSLNVPRSRMGRIAAARGALYMISVQPREQQVAEKPFGEHLYTSYHIISYHIISYHIISYHIISYHIISYHIISYHIISYHIISYHHVISYHVISYLIISYIVSGIQVM